MISANRARLAWAAVRKGMRFFKLGGVCWFAGICWRVQGSQAFLICWVWLVDEWAGGFVTFYVGWRAVKWVRWWWWGGWFGFRGAMVIEWVRGLWVAWMLAKVLVVFGYQLVKVAADMPKAAGVTGFY